MYIQGLTELIKEIQAEYGEESIKNLCKGHGNTFELVPLQAASPILETARKFDIMQRKHSTDLFNSVWKNHLFSIRNSYLVIEDITSKIWEPTFSKCNDLLNSVCDKSIKLTDVDLYMKPLDENKAMQLKRLHSGLSECVEDSKIVKSSPELIDEAVHLMEEYLSLKDLAQAAKTVIKLKEILTLCGDFTLIEKLATKVSFCMKILLMNNLHYCLGFFIWRSYEFELY